MFKNKNKITKVTNVILIILFALMAYNFIMIIATGGKINDKIIYLGNDYWYNIVKSGGFMISLAIAFLIINFKLDIYKDEYPTSRKLFNFFILFALLNSFLEILISVSSGILYKSAIMPDIVFLIIGYIPCYGLTIKIVNNGKLLSKDNTQRENATNFMIAYLLMSNYLCAVKALVDIRFNLGDLCSNLQNLVVYLLLTCIILLADKMIKRNNSIKKDKKEVKVIEEKKTKETKKSVVKKEKKPVKKTTKKVK